MIAKDENALICDFAETYRIYNYKELPPSQAAIYAVGLSEDSRIKRKLSGQKHTVETLLLSHIADSLRILVWMRTKDGRRNVNRPKSILEEIMADRDQYEAFDSIEAYEAARAKIVR